MVEGIVVEINGVEVAEPFELTYEVEREADRAGDEPVEDDSMAGDSADDDSGRPEIEYYPMLNETSPEIEVSFDEIGPPFSDLEDVDEVPLEAVVNWKRQASQDGPRVAVLLPAHEFVTWELTEMLESYATALTRAGAVVDYVSPELDFAAALAAIGRAKTLLIVSLGKYSAPVRTAVLGRLHSVVFLHLLPIGVLWPFAGINERSVMSAARANVFPSLVAMRYGVARSRRAARAYRNLHVFYPYIEPSPLSKKDEEKVSGFLAEHSASKVWVGDVFDGSEKLACNDDTANLFVIPTRYEHIECFGEDGERVFTNEYLVRPGAVNLLLENAELLYSVPVAGFAPFGVPVAIAIGQKSKYTTTGEVGATELLGRSKKWLKTELQRFASLVLS